MQPIIFLESGCRRKGEEFNCKFCGKKSIRRIKAHKGRRKKEFCDIKCSGMAARNRLTVKCQNCGKKIYRTHSRVETSRHGVFFCGRKCKDYAQSLNGDCKEIRPPHYGNGEYSYRNRTAVKKQLAKGCIDCLESKYYLLVVHHIDGDRTNNKESNLEVVCRNCHTRRHLRLKDGQWIFGHNSLTPRELLSTV